MEEFECSICHKKYNRLLYKVSCEQSHGVVYVPIYKEDVVKLMQFIYSAYVFADIENEIPGRLIKTLQKIISMKPEQEVLTLDLYNLSERDSE